MKDKISVNVEGNGNSIINTIINNQEEAPLTERDLDILKYLNLCKDLSAYLMETNGGSYFISENRSRFEISRREVDFLVEGNYLHPTYPDKKVFHLTRKGEKIISENS